MNAHGRVVFVEPGDQSPFPGARLSRPTRCERIDIRSELAEFSRRFGHTRVPTTHWQETQTSGALFPLGLALSRLRYSLRGRQEIIAAGGVASRADQYFIDGIAHLEEFARKPRTAVKDIEFCPSDGFPLGKWTRDLRHGVLEVSDERIAWADEQLALRRCSPWAQRLLSVDRNGNKTKRKARAA